VGATDFPREPITGLRLTDASRVPSRGFASKARVVRRVSACASMLADGDRTRPGLRRVYDVAHG
jgi:hypothetical protein